jgi:hypothetical protein
MQDDDSPWLKPRTCSAFDSCATQYGLLMQSDDSELSTFGPETPNHKNLIPINARDVIGWLIACVTLFVAAGGGIGGGGVLVPLYIIGLHFETEHAVALSNLTIAGGAFANLLCNLHRCALQHPPRACRSQPCIATLIMVLAGLRMSLAADRANCLDTSTLLHGYGLAAVARHSRDTIAGSTHQRTGRSSIGT